MIRSIELNRLHLSDLNVRKTDTNLDIEELADDIADKGLLQNLVVVPYSSGLLDGAAANGRGRFGVVAGGRRLRALQLLVERGVIKDNHPIPVVVEKVEEGREVSLAENQRVPMNPADECRAFADIIADYEAHGEADPAARLARCAHRFYVTERHVQERLRLAALAPEIFEALRTGAISLDAAKAYAAYSDQVLQMKVYAGQEAQGGGHRVQAIRAELAGKVYRRGDRQVRYIGVDAYLAAGGRLELELFMGLADEEVLLDTELVDRLVRAKAEPEAAALAKAQGFAGAELAPWPIYSALPKTPKGYAPVCSKAGALTAAARTEAIAIFTIFPDGTLHRTDDYFAPIAASVTPAAASSSPTLVTGLGTRPAPLESELDRLARLRRDRIRERAAHAAVPSVKGTALEDRLFFPPLGERQVPAIGEDDAGNIVVAVLVTIPKADVERCLGEAERAEDGLPAPPRFDEPDDDWSRVRAASRAGPDEESSPAWVEPVEDERETAPELEEAL